MFCQHTSKALTKCARASARALKENHSEQVYKQSIRAMGTGDIGSGSGKGGGSGGSIRDAGGSLGSRQAAQEESYFRKKDAEMKDKLKKHLADEIKKNEDAIKASKKLMQDIENEK